MNKKDDSKKAYARLRQRAETILKETAGKRADTTDQDLLETLHELEVQQVELDLQNETLRRTAKNLEAARDKYFAFYEFAPVGFVTLDKTGRVEKANAAADLLQRPERFLVGQTFSSRVYPEDLPAYFAEMKKSSESAVKGAKESLELRLLGKDDRIRHFHLDIGAEFDKQGRFRSWQLAIVDITELKKAQKTAQESEKRYRALVEASSNGVYRMSPDWREMRYLLGKDFIPDTEEPSPTWLPRYIHPDDQEHVMAVINKAIRTKSVFELEHRVLRVDGSLGWTLSRAIPILDVYGEIIEWFGMVKDVSEHKQMEEEQRKSRDDLELRVKERTAELQKMNEELKNEIERRKKFEADLNLQSKKVLKEQERRKYLSKKLVEILERERQEIAESLHNDVGQILTKLNMDLDDVIDSGEQAPIRADALVKIQSSIIKSMDHVSWLAGSLRPHILENLGLVPAIKNMLNKMQDNSGVSFHFHTEEAFLRIDDETALAIYRIAQEAVTNCLKHARAKDIMLNLARKDKFLSIIIEDDGTGFEYDKITPSHGKKEKLGLIIMQERAIQIGGEFNVESQVGKGTRVILEIPVK